MSVSCGAEQTYTIAKRYSDFLVFDSMLRTAFPTLATELAPLPSKLTLINKEETRKKTFHTYVDRLSKLISSTEAVTTKDALMRKLGEFLRLPGTEESKQDDLSQPDQRHSSLVDKEQVNPRSGSYAGYLEVQYHSQPWTRYYCSLQASDALFEERKPGEEDREKGDLPMLDLYLFANEAESHFQTVICLKGGEIKEHPLEKSTLELRFDYNEHPILLRCLNPDELEAWKRELIQKMTTSHSISLTQAYPNCGLLHVHGNSYPVGGLTGLKLPKPAVSVIKPHVYVQLTVPPYIYCTAIKPQKPTIEWNQDFILPVGNRFAKLQVDVISFSSEGWLTQHPKRESVTSFLIPVPFISLHPFHLGPVTIPLALPTKGPKPIDSDLPSDMSLTMTLEDWSNLSSIILKPPESYIEDIPVPKTMSLGKLKIAMKRVKRLLIFWKNFWLKFKMIQMWVYPRFSAFIMTILVLVTLFLPAQYIMPFFLGTFLLLFGLCHPVGDYLLGNYLYRTFFLPKYRGEAVPRVKTMKECDDDKLKDFGNFTIDVRPVGMLEKYKILKKDLADVQVDLSRIACWIEKVRK